MDSGSSNVITTIIGIIGAFVVGITLYYLGSFHKKRDLKKSLNIEKSATADREFSDACREFISAFDDALSRLDSTGDFASAILLQTMPSHKISYETFRRMLEKCKGSEAVSGLDEKWKEYYDTETYGKNPFAAYDNGSSTKENKQKDRELAITRINAILDFVNQL